MNLRFDHARVLDISRAVKAAGGRAYLVGGLVRDRLLGANGEARDYDLEVFGLDGAALRAILTRFGRVNAVGEAFTVYKIGDIDVSIPRRDSKTGTG
ncbi:MAG: tRNA nucleotidyltransferase, partial [Planctomycetota bacterium]